MPPAAAAAAAGARPRRGGGGGGGSSSRSSRSSRGGGGGGVGPPSGGSVWTAVKNVWYALSPIVRVLIVATSVAGPAWTFYSAYTASDAYAAKQALWRLEASFATHPESTPIEDLAEKHSVAREERVMKEIEGILFRAPGRHVIVGPSGSGKTSTVKMVAREAGRNGVVFVDLKGSNDADAVVATFSATFNMSKDKVLSALPLALRAFRDKTGRFATIIIEDAQGALSPPPPAVALLLQRLAACAEANAVNLVFLSSEGDLPAQLRKMSGWSRAVREYRLNVVDEETMRKHLVEVWKLDAQLAGDIVERIGCGMRDVFKCVLKNLKPGESIDAAVVNSNVETVIEESKRSIDAVLKRLKDEERAAAGSATGSRRAAVLLLDHLLTTPSAAVYAAYNAYAGSASRPPEEQFIHAESVLVDSNILRFVDAGKVTWHGRPYRTAYAALRATDDYRAILKAPG